MVSKDNIICDYDECDKLAYQSKIAVALNLQWDLGEISSLVSSTRKHNPQMPIFGLNFGEIGRNTRDFARRNGVAIVDCSKEFSGRFMCFDIAKVHTCLAPVSKRVVSKYAFGPFLIPFIREFKNFEKVIWLDNRCVATTSFRGILDHQTENFATLLNMPQDGIVCETQEFLRKYDKESKLAYKLTTPVGIIFNMKRLDWKYGNSLKMLDELQMKSFNENGFFHDPQDFCNVMLDSDVVDGRAYCAVV